MDVLCNFLIISLHFHYIFGIEVTGPPAFTYVTLNSTAVLSCFITEQNGKTVIWSKIEDGKPISYFQIFDGGVVGRDIVYALPDGDDYKVEVDPVGSIDYWANMTIATVDHDDPGQYSCFTGSVHDIIKGELVLAVPPSNTEISDSSGGIVVLFEGVAQTLTCAAYNSKPQVSMQWTIAGSSVAEDSTSFTKNIDGTYTTYSYMTHTYTNAMHHGKSVKCVATNMAGTKSTSVTSYVLLFASTVPTAVTETGKIAVLEGASTTLTCTPDGRPPPTCTWKHQSTDLPTPTPDPCQLDLNNIKRSEAGTYICTASNSTSSQDVTFEIYVLFSPTTNRDNVIEFVDEGSKALLMCEAEGNPPPEFTWTKDSTDITGSEDHTELYVSDPVNLYKYSTLTIDSIDPERDYGEYVCIAANSYGYDILTIKLTRKTVPQPPVGIALLNATDVELVLKWTEGENGGHPQTFIVEYRVYGSGTEWNDSSKFDDPPATLVGLQPMTRYEIRVRSQNQLGESGHSETITANTIGPFITKVLGEVDITPTPTMIGFTATGVFLIFTFLLGVFIKMKNKIKGKEDIIQCITCKNHLDQHFETHTVIEYHPVAPNADQHLETNETIEYQPLAPDAGLAEMIEQNHLTYSDENWEFPRNWLKLEEKVGSGEFGQVWRAKAKNITGNIGRTIVAVKTLKENVTKETKKDLLSELELMKLLAPHTNVVSLLGCCTENDPIYVIVEFVPHGNLQKFLRDHRSQTSSVYKNLHGGSKDLTPLDLLSFAYDTAKGMEYLSSMKCIHRDLAARNVLVGEKKVCKVADFGFARDVLDTGEYEKKTQGRLPLRWMALESLLDSKYTLKSDVWSFGVLLWEIVAMGSSPYPGMNSVEIIEKLQDGYRMPKPQHCSEQMYSLMLHCWEADQKQRRSFSQLVRKLHFLMKNNNEPCIISDLDERAYYNLGKYSIAGEIV